MNVTLTPELEQLVRSKVESGRYQSESEVVRDALRQMELGDEDRAHRLKGLRNRMDLALAQADSGELADGETFMQGLLSEIGECEAKRES